jgi:hypothetical protein
VYALKLEVVAFFADDNENGAPPIKEGANPVGVCFNRQADAGPAADEVSRAGKSTPLRFPLSAFSLFNKNVC